MPVTETEAVKLPSIEKTTTSVWFDSDYIHIVVGHTYEDDDDHFGRENSHVKVEECVISTDDHPHLKRMVRRVKRIRSYTG